MKNLKMIGICMLSLTPVLSFAGNSANTEKEGLKAERGMRGEQFDKNRHSPEEVFNKIDANSDGQLSKDEFSSFHQKMKEKRMQKMEDRKERLEKEPQRK